MRPAAAIAAPEADGDWTWAAACWAAIIGTPGALAAAPPAVTGTGCGLAPDVAGADVLAVSVTASSARGPAAG